ncbi:MAG: ATP-binding cassette domain-containing protein [Oxalobacteraceae bacterium]|nr:ATP-binding cassette domain-containing protein [Oxalobacteraceae bacterium]
MPALAIRNVSVSYPVRGKPPVHALKNIDFEIHDKDFVVALGASGCGKSTLLNLIAGFMAPSEGEISLNERIVTGPGADRSVVFQKHALLPWLNVLDNVAFGLKIQGYDRQKRENVARKFINLLGLEQFEQSAIYELSGGMQQRVGIARALTSDPDILLMDEPLGALDAFSVEEALFMGTKLIVMSPRPGRISHVFDLPFSRRYFDSGNAREIKASTEFIALRETILQIIFKDEAGARNE